MSKNRNFDLMYGMTVEEIIESDEFTMQEKDDFFEEIQMFLSEKYAEECDNDENYRYFNDDDYE